jgi:hypothetical protein
MSIIKWLWRKAEKHTLDRVLWEIDTQAMYHRQRSEVMNLKEKYEPKDDEDDNFRRLIKQYELTGKEHYVAAKTLGELYDRLQPRERVNDLVATDKDLK